MKRSSIILLLVFSFYSITYGQFETIPDPPRINFISINPVTGFTEFSWKPSDSVDVVAYIIHVWTGPEDTRVVDTIEGRFTTSFTWEKPWGNISSEAYSLSSLRPTEGGGKESKLTEPHTTMFLKLEFESCTGAMKLNWNAYGGWGDSLSHYTVFKKENDEEFTSLTLGDDQLSYTDEVLSPYNKYCYYIEANHKDGRKSTSNMVCDSSNMPRPPIFINAKGTVINNENQVELSFFIDPAAELDTYYLIRGENRNSLTDTVEIKKQQGGGAIGFEDKIPEAKPYYYQLLSMNDCGLEARRSNIASTLQLNAANAGNRNLLTWNPYIDWPGGVKNYEIYRSLDGGTFELISPGPGPSDTSFTDRVGDLILEQGVSEFCYYITAAEGGENLHGPGFSKSNQICVNAESVILMPNAFTPNGDNLNDEFKPVLTFSPKSYLFIIRNRWGNTLFETDDPEVPWIGDSKGKPVPEGVYVFYVKAEDQQGKILEKTGQVMVLFPEN